ncbi:GNAT family N-acetyltransferase [Microvirga sp. VF16]|uniref:GNAT family N-acetyltransferase n=1 Tax=Microvirga sp. VF16 TaxID=2807101 RepID=UPI00193D8A17|nr:GNAT family N-acetyltransferase [Microvirga sp. VF16]QRM27225.1 GNAT family N-acetyltransferase [Microvirga sp. VF16]
MRDTASALGSNIGYNHNPAPSSRPETFHVDLRTVTVRDVDALTMHRVAWDRLAWEAPQKLPFLLSGWVNAFLRHRLKPNERWFCSFIYASERLVGVLPVIVTPHSLFGSSRPTLRTPYDAHTPSGDVLLAPDCALAAFQALLAEVGRQEPTHLGFDFKAVRRNSPLWAGLSDECQDYVMCLGLRSMFSFLDVRGDFEDYLASLGSIPKNLRRYRKKLEGRGRVSVEVQTSAAPSEEFLAEYLALEASGWKGRNGTAMRDDPNTIAFYEALVRNFTAQGWWEWHAVRVDDCLVAARMAIRCGRSLLLPKIAFNEDFADCRPGMIVTGEVFRDAFSRPDLDEVNHISDADAHRLWHMPRDEYVDVHLIRRAALPMLCSLPRILMQSAYQKYVRPHIPVAVKRVYRKFERRGDRKPRRASDARRQ